MGRERAHGRLLTDAANLQRKNVVVGLRWEVCLRNPTPPPRIPPDKSCPCARQVGRPDYEAIEDAKPALVAARRPPGSGSDPSGETTADRRLTLQPVPREQPPGNSRAQGVH